MRGDEGDIAADYQARHNAAALADHQRRQAARIVSAALPAAICEWCKKQIPPGRRRAEPGCTLCVSCQADKERRKGKS